MPTGNLPTGGGPPWWLPVVGSIAGSIIDAVSQDRANKANARNVQAQIDFQREQNATAYQRAVADLRAAGLNPSLAYKQGGANSGSGNAAESRPLTAGNRLAAAVEAYNQFATSTAQRELIREQTNATQQQAALTNVQARKTNIEASAAQPEALLGVDSDYIENYINARRQEARGRRFTAEKVPEVYAANLAQTKQGINTAAAQERLMRSASTLNEQQFQNEWFRKNISPYINSTTRVLEGVGDVTRMGKGLTGYKPLTRYY